jgi:hypothetical protein
MHLPRLQVGGVRPECGLASGLSRREYYLSVLGDSNWSRRRASGPGSPFYGATVAHSFPFVLIHG